MKLDREKAYRALDWIALMAFPVLSVLGILYLADMIPYLVWKISLAIPFLWAAAFLFLMFSEHHQEQPKSRPLGKALVFVCLLYFAVILIVSYVKK